MESRSDDMKLKQQRYDVVIVGGGAAGLSGALTLARARRSVLVIDAGEPRNAPASHVHNYLGRESSPPGELLAIGRGEAAGYGAEIVEGRVASAERLPGDRGFRVATEDGRSVEARRLLVTTGLVDELPPVPGLAERWGREVLHCPYCHGHEVADRPIGVLATGALAVHQALMWRQWSEDVTLFRHTGPEPTDEEYEQLAARGVAVVDGEVTGLEVTDEHFTGVRLAAWPGDPARGAGGPGAFRRAFGRTGITGSGPGGAGDGRRGDRHVHPDRPDRCDGGPRGLGGRQRHPPHRTGDRRCSGGPHGGRRGERRPDHRGHP